MLLLYAAEEETVSLEQVGGENERSGEKCEIRKRYMTTSKNKTG